MFRYCRYGLRMLDLGYFDTSEVTDMSEMFYYCYWLGTIYVGDGWNTAKVTSSTNMFYDCSSIEGGQGTSYSSSNNKDKTYARVDAPGTPGYLSYKYHPTAFFYYEGELLFTLHAPMGGGTVSLPSAAEMLNNYFLKQVTYTCNDAPFNAATEVKYDVDVTVNGTSVVTPQIIDGDATSFDYSNPYGNHRKYSTSQIIYKASELNGEGTIKGISFKVQQAAELATTSVDIYLGHKANATFSSTSDYMTESNLTHVYYGSPTLGRRSEGGCNRLSVHSRERNHVG